MVSIKTILEELMFHDNLTQKEFAGKYKVEESQVTRWLAGKTTPRLETYNRLKEEYDKLAGAKAV